MPFVWRIILAAACSCVTPAIAVSSYPSSAGDTPIQNIKYLHLILIDLLCRRFYALCRYDIINSTILRFT